jgi:carnitine O-palmitoyltransferase 2
MGSLEAVIEDKSSPEKYPLGILTTQERNKWAEVRDHLIKSSAQNKKSIEEIDSALFVICLDDEVLRDDPVRVTRQFLHSDGTNRWFDKSFQMISSKDGWAGVTFEHAWGDGVAVLRFFNEIHKDATSNQFSNATKPKRPAHLPQKLTFEYDDKAKKEIDEAKKRLLAQTSSLDIHTFIFDKYGKQECKHWAISPDSVMQLGFQIAFYRLFNYTPASYESCSTAAFKHGRTEAIRPATSLTQKVSQILSKNDWTNRKSELKDLIKKCSQKHNELTKEAAMGQGFDRHLFALKIIAQQKGLPIPDLYNDLAYKRINANAISTSTLASPAVRIGAFGPVIPDGFGLGYQIWEGGLGCVTGTYKGKRDGQAWVDTCHQVFTDIQTIMSS